MGNIRTAIEEDRFPEYKKEFFSKYEEEHMENETEPAR
jgi:queuine/archaeosine tRNA-ribosyltransferase